MIYKCWRVPRQFFAAKYQIWPDRYNGQRTVLHWVSEWIHLSLAKNMYVTSHHISDSDFSCELDVFSAETYLFIKVVVQARIYCVQKHQLCTFYLFFHYHCFFPCKCNLTKYFQATTVNTFQLNNSRLSVSLFFFCFSLGLFFRAETDRVVFIFRKIVKLLINYSSAQ